MPRATEKTEIADLTRSREDTKTDGEDRGVRPAPRSGAPETEAGDHKHHPDHEVFVISGFRLLRLAGFAGRLVARSVFSARLRDPVAPCEIRVLRNLRARYTF